MMEMLEKMTKLERVRRPMMGGTRNGRAAHFDYWRVGYGQREDGVGEVWIEQAGEYHCKKGHRYAVYEYQVHRWTRVLYVTYGALRCVIDGVPFELVEGDFLVIPPHHPHVFEGERPCHYHYFALVGRWPLAEQEGERVVKWQIGKDVEVIEHFEGMREGLIWQKPGYMFYALGRLYGLLGRIEGLRPRGRQSGQCQYPEAVRLALTYIEERCVEPFSAAETAASAHVSASHLRALFEKWVGESPKRYHTQCRIERAKRLLHEQALPVHQVAAQVGYGDVGYFSRVFKQMTGVAPSRFG